MAREILTPGTQPEYDYLPFFYSREFDLSWQVGPGGKRAKGGVGVQELRLHWDAMDCARPWYEAKAALAVRQLSVLCNSVCHGGDALRVRPLFYEHTLT